MQDSAPPRSDQAPDPSELIGTTLAGRYQMERRLGMGGMGAVYLGEHLRMGRKDAIKVLKPELARDPEALARFTRGARAVSRIRHPNVCQVYDFGETEDGLLFLAMEFIDGPSLSSILEKEGRLKAERAVRFIRQAGEALQVAHELGIIHRDLKPENLMIGRGPDGSEQLKVVDFDIARGTEEEGPGVTRQGFVIGTPEYMSPEQLTGDPLDARSDIYSLALVLFHCLSGRLPFEGTTAQEAMIQRLKVEPLRLSQAAPGRDFPPGLEEAIHTALSKLPDERPATALEFARAVGDTLSSGPVATVRTPAQDTEDPDATRLAPAVPRPPEPAGGVEATQVAPSANAPAATVEQAGSAVPATQMVSGSGTKGPRKRTLALGGGALALTALLATGFFVLQPGVDPAVEPTAGDIPAASDPVASSTDSESGDASSADAAGLVGQPQSGGDRGAEPPPRETTAPSGDGTRTAATDTRERTRVEEPAPTSRTEAPPAGARPIALPAGVGPFQQLIFRQWDRQVSFPDDAEVLRAARDTAAAVWQSPGATPPDSAFAAHVMGLTLIGLGDRARGIDWLERAVDVQPLDRYVGPLEAHRRMQR